MKRLTLFLLIVSIFFTCFGQRKIKKVEVTEEGVDVKLIYNPIVDEITKDGLTYKFIPISPDELNSLFNEENSYDGRFSYSYFEESRESYFLNRQRKRIQEKDDNEFLIEGADWLIENDFVNQKVYDELVKKIIYFYDEERGDELYSLNKTAISNPYFIGTKYLNLFKVEISNASDLHKISNEYFTIENGKHTLISLDEVEISSLLNLGDRYNILTEQTLARNHYSPPISIPPNSVIQKLIATLPIDYQYNDLLLSINGSSRKKANWKIDQDVKRIYQKYIFNEFNVDFKYDGSESSYGTAFNVIISDVSVGSMDGDALYIDENYLDEEFEIMTIALYNDKLYYNRTTAKGNDLINHEKQRRLDLEIDLLKITSLTIKVR